MSDTPRTVEATKTTDWITGVPIVSADFARELERELNAANERISELEKYKARYDFIKDCNGTLWRLDGFGSPWQLFCGVGAFSNAELDRVIDEAMEGKQ